MQIRRNLELQILQVKFHSSYTYSKHRLKNGGRIYKKTTDSRNLIAVLTLGKTLLLNKLVRNIVQLCSFFQ